MQQVVLRRAALVLRYDDLDVVAQRSAQSERLFVREPERHAQMRCRRKERQSRVGTYLATHCAYYGILSALQLFVSCKREFEPKRAALFIPKLAAPWHYASYTSAMDMPRVLS